jgi:hypothetical protein
MKRHNKIAYAYNGSTNRHNLIVFVQNEKWTRHNSIKNVHDIKMKPLCLVKIDIVRQLWRSIRTNKLCRGYWILFSVFEVHAHAHHYAMSELLDNIQSAWCCCACELLSYVVATGHYSVCLMYLRMHTI